MTIHHGRVVAVHLSDSHGLGKEVAPSVHLEAGRGVTGDIHAGADVKHLSRTGTDDVLPNLRQVLLLASEELAGYRELGFDATPGSLGENITTEGIALHKLTVGTAINLGSDAVVCLTGVRNPCHQIEKKFPGLLKKMAFKNARDEVEVRGGVMAVVIRSGEVREGDPVVATESGGPRHKLERV